jgi:hypothetical protein
MKKSIYAAALLVSLLVTSCWYNRQWEDLHPSGQSATTGGCDTTGVISYSVNIKPMISANCGSCHDGVSGTDYNSYTNLRSSALAGTLMYRINLPPSNGLHMPQGQGYLPACDTLKLVKWIKNGCPNN